MGLLAPNNPIKIVDTILAGDPTTVDDYYAQQVKKGYEGIIYRLGSCPYTYSKQEGNNGRSRYLSDKHNRVWHMLKRKDWQDGEFTCVRVTEGEGKRSSMVGAFICETTGGNYFGVGSGLTDQEAISYYENPPIGRKIKVKYLCLTSDGVPFNPTVEAIL
jgi:ATP-dependent DNA ligase